MGSARRNTIRLVVVGLCVALVGCGGGGKPVPPPTGGATTSKAEQARKSAEELALNGVKGGANAQAKAAPETAVRHGLPFDVAIGGTKPGIAVKGSTPTVGPAPPGGPPGPDTKAAPAPAPAPVVKGPKSTPRPGWVIRERVVSTIPYPTEAEAEEDVLILARELVARKLAQLDPPLKHEPSLGEVKTEFLRKDSRHVRPPDADEKEALALYGGTENRVYVEYDVEVTAEQVRELRAQERVSVGVRVVGALIAVALAGFLFLRADEWTKGYLTRWLALAAVTLAGGVAAALIFV